MSLVPVKTHSVVKKMFPNYIWDIKTTEPVIYLTFDDGPTPDITEWILQLLSAYNAKATFFCIGNNIEKYPTAFKSIVNQGHSIGNHTHDHLKGWKTKMSEYLSNVELCDSVLKSYKNQTSLTCLFRPPYGRIKPKQAKALIALGYRIVMWDVLSFDWDKNVSKEKCLENIIENTDKGSIIVLHDSIKASKNMTYVLPKILEYYSKKGFFFKGLNL